MSILHFKFFKLIEGVSIDTALRLSLWLEKNSSYLMPCQFIKVFKNVDYYDIKVQVLDPNSFIKDNFIGERFFFGHPGKIIGYGFLQKII